MATGISFFSLFKTLKNGRMLANRSIYVDGQKFLIEICKSLVADPDLWCLYDDHPLAKEKAELAKTTAFQAKLTAFAHLHLNMFEIVLLEAPPPGGLANENQSNVWHRYFQDTLLRSHVVRAILEEPQSWQIWSPRLLKEYRHWKDQRIPNRGAFSTSA